MTEKLIKVVRFMLDGALLALIVFGWILAVVMASGCAHCPPVDPVVVKVPVPVAADPLPLAEMPTWQTPAADPADPAAYLRALAHDLLAAWALIAEDRHTIAAYNSTVAAPD